MVKCLVTSVHPRLAQTLKMAHSWARARSCYIEEVFMIPSGDQANCSACSQLLWARTVKTELL